MNRGALYVWRGTFGALALFSFVMAWVSIWNPGDLRLAAGYAFVYAASAFLALDPDARDWS